MTIRDLSDRTLRSAYERSLTQVSHELAMPLTALLLTVQQLEKVGLQAALESSESATKEELSRLLESALRQVRQLHMLVDDLADAVRTQGDKLQLTREPVDLVALAQRIAEDLARTQPTPPIIVRPEVKNQHSIIVKGDSMRLEQVVHSLLANAQKFAPESERVDVRIRRIHKRGAAEVAELEVQDYGPGIPAAEQPFLFTPFYQGMRGSVIARAGLGLGLYLAQQVVQAHGGQIAVRSSAGEGTVFTIRLPVTAGSKELLAPAHPDARLTGAADGSPEENH